ncbi:MAG: hypothetical protein ACRDRL_24040, partial [Sciscionella sp.]
MSTPFLTGSYITVEEYRAAPTAMQTNNLVPGQPQATQDAELAGIIGRASRWIDNIANQSLYATAGQQTERSRVDRDGNAVLRAHQDRVKTIDTFAWGVHQTQLNTFTPPIGAWIEENRSLIPLSPTGSWFGNLPALARPVGGSVFVRWSYTAGWVTTRLSAAATIGASTI